MRCLRLPRMRGDRPQAQRKKEAERLATPHARGSTHNASIYPPGYPACAGIDPSRGGVEGGASRLPRMRGDRPAAIKMKDDAIQATPHARGSTSFPPRGPVLQLGYPACAGIGPQLWRWATQCLWLPRMRGDRPPLVQTADHAQSATPHARGSTHRLSFGGQFGCGYPACAGIDPAGSQGRGHDIGLPRMRGDRPQSAGAR